MHRAVASTAAPVDDWLTRRIRIQRVRRDEARVAARNAAVHVGLDLSLDFAIEASTPLCVTK